MKTFLRTHRTAAAILAIIGIALAAAAANNLQKATDFIVSGGYSGGSTGSTIDATGIKTHALTADTITGAASSVTVVDAASDTTTWVGLFGSQTGAQAPLSDAGITFNSSTNVLSTSVSGNASTATALATPRAIYGNNFDGSSALAQIIASTFGGTGNGFTKFSGPTTSEKTFTLPDASSTIVVQGGALGTPTSGTATNLSGTAASLTAGTCTTVPALSGDVSTSGNTTTIGAAKVTLAMMANLAQSTIVGRAAGAGTGVPTALTATQATAILNDMVGDSGSGGTAGRVPAPASGDAAANKFLKANGTWTAVSGAGIGDFSGPGSSTDNAVVRFDGTGGKTGQNSLMIIDDSGNVTGVVALTTTGAFIAPSINVASDGTISHFKTGTWTPTVTGTANIDSTSGPTGTYARIGNNVFFGFTVSADATLSAATLTRFRFTLPVASDITSATNDVQGSGACDGTVNEVAVRTFGDATNDAIICQFYSGDTAAEPLSCSGVYRVN